MTKLTPLNPFSSFSLLFYALLLVMLWQFVGNNFLPVLFSVAGNIIFFAVVVVCLSFSIHLKKNERDTIGHAEQEVKEVMKLVQKYVPDKTVPPAGELTPVKFEECNQVIGAGQQGVEPLPAFVSDTGDVVSCWHLDAAAVRSIINTRRIWVCQHNGGDALQPIYISPIKLINTTAETPN